MWHGPSTCLNKILIFIMYCRREVRDLIEQRDIAQKSAIVTVKQGVEQARMQVEKVCNSCTIDRTAD